MPDKKQTSTPISKIIIFGSFLLMVLPFINSFNSFLTEILMKWQLYRILQEMVVPYEARVLAGLMNFLHFSASATPKGVWVSGGFISIEWNCIGWQSAVLLLASYLSGFQGKYSQSSRLEVILIGFLGTYLINIFRLTAVAFLSLTTTTGVAIFFHDYLALVMVLMWFMFFWWFSYSFVLEERV